MPSFVIEVEGFDGSLVEIPFTSMEQMREGMAKRMQNADGETTRYITDSSGKKWDLAELAASYSMMHLSEMAGLKVAEQQKVDDGSSVALITVAGIRVGTQQGHPAGVPPLP